MTAEEINALAQAIVAQLNFPTKEEILETIADAMPGSSRVCEAIAKGISDSMPFPSEILNAIMNGIVESRR